MIFISLQEIIEDHFQIIERYGGVHGIRDIGLLASAIEMPKAALYEVELHPSAYDKAAAYMFHLIGNHPFVDGNKRIATASALTFLRQNQYLVRLSQDQSCNFEELIVSTAQGNITKLEIAAFLEAVSAPMAAGG